jgi:hypothetical protein
MKAPVVSVAPSTQANAPSTQANAQLGREETVGHRESKDVNQDMGQAQAVFLRTESEK